MNKIVKFAIAFFLLASLFAAPLMDNGAVVSAQGAKAQWEAIIEMNPEQISYAKETNAEMAASIQAKGITASINDGRLELSGTQGIEQLRSALFDDAAQWVDFLGGPVELTLVLPAGNAPVTLQMEARLTTGYGWEVLAAKEARYAQNGEATYAMRYRGLGAPAIQTIQLQSKGAGDGTVRLVYRRPFEKDAPIHARVTLWVAETGGVIELSDPTPTEPTSEDAGQSGDEANPYAELLPKALPASYDARPLGIIPDVRDQGGCGSCWAFGTVSVMETAVKKGGGPLTDLSEQFLISCNTSGWSCNGGLTASKYHYNTLGKAQTAIGAVLESVKPYTATNGTCTVALSHPYKASAWQFLTGSEWTMPTNDQIKNAIITYGSVTAGVCVDSGWDTYTSGVYNPTSNVCGGSTNHQIALVGWDDATQSWILRNSWGPGWGESGYMRIKYNPTGTNSRVGEGTSWIKYGGSTPTTLKTYTPSGNTYTNKPTYSWSRISTATSYKLRVKDVAAGTYPINGIAVSKSYCKASTDRCSYTPATTLTYNKSYQWQVAAGSGAYTALKSFKPLPSFNSQFNGNATGWLKRPGAAWANSATTYYTNGVMGKWSSTSYNKNFGNFTYEARMKRMDTSGYSSGMRIRGTPTFDGYNGQNNDYLFVYAVYGTTEYFSVWKHVAGVETTLQTWTTTTAVNPSNWNTLKVIVDGTSLRFYINGTLVWSGSDSEFKTGQVALTMFQNTTTASRFDVDWAKLGMSELYKADEQVEAGQVEITPDPSVPYGSERVPVAP